MRAALKVGQVKKKCFTVSGAELQAGHVGDGINLYLARCEFKGLSSILILESQIPCLPVHSL